MVCIIRDCKVADNTIKEFPSQKILLSFTRIDVQMVLLIGHKLYQCLGSILIWIRILNLHWKKKDPASDPGYFFKIY